MTNQLHKPMMHRRRHRFSETSIGCKRKAPDVGFTRAMLFAPPSAGCEMPVKPWNMEKTMKVIGPMNFLSNRYTIIKSPVTPCLTFGKLKEKIIPAFEKAHGPGYQALFMVDNSQGHSTYLEDALLVSRMNVKPGGKQARMHDDWFMWDGQKISQPMVFPLNHPEFPNVPKGIKAVLAECSLYQSGLRGKCQNKCEQDNCCNKHLLEHQPDFLEQKSLVQGVIKAAGHLCIFLPKFHCELNFIEFFWSAVKKYLRDNCDYTFDTLKENMPKALASVQH